MLIKLFINCNQTRITPPRGTCVGRLHISDKQSPIFPIGQLESVAWSRRCSISSGMTVPESDGGKKIMITCS